MGVARLAGVGVVGVGVPVAAGASGVGVGVDTDTVSDGMGGLVLLTATGLMTRLGGGELTLSGA